MLKKVSVFKLFSTFGNFLSGPNLESCIWNENALLFKRLVSWKALHFLAIF